MNPAWMLTGEGRLPIEDQKMIPIMRMNVDRIVKASEFDDPNSIYLSSIFRTVQGEGPYAGMPAVFVRFAGCNYGDKKSMCAFCDTDFRIDNSRRLTVAALVGEIYALRKRDDIVVITGGEPTLQAEALISLLNHMPGIVFQLESNGTQAKFFEMYRKQVFNHLRVLISPKANEVAKTYPVVKPVVLDQTGHLKFLISADSDSVYHTVPESIMASKRGHTQVWVSPIAVYKRPYEGEVSSAWDHDLIDAEATAANYSYCARYVMENPGLRMSIQQHLFAAIA